jgi:hypothetical protein
MHDPSGRFMGEIRRPSAEEEEVVEEPPATRGPRLGPSFPWIELVDRAPVAITRNATFARRPNPGAQEGGTVSSAADSRRRGALFTETMECGGND